MSYNIGYVSVPHSTYDEWRNTINGNGWNVDNSWGCQCYDLALLFWWNVGFPPGYPVSSTLGANGIWPRRLENIAFGGTVYFDIINNLGDVKRGDVIIYQEFPGNQYGHVGFADEDYSTWSVSHPGDYEFPILSENNNGTPDPQGGSYANIHGYDTRLFLGAFRYREWNQGPTPVQSKHKFPWYLIANKLRNQTLYGNI